MSREGIKKAAAVFSLMQETRDELLRSGDHQNLRLGQMLEVGKDAMKWDFCRITSEPDKRKGREKKR